MQTLLLQCFFPQLPLHVPSFPAARPQALSQSGIILGTASENVQYEMDKDEMMVAFVQERDLWLYDTKASEFTQIFSFADQEGSDMATLATTILPSP